MSIQPMPNREPNTIYIKPVIFGGQVRYGAVHYADDHEIDRVDVQSQFDLLVSQLD